MLHTKDLTINTRTVLRSPSCRGGRCICVAGSIAAAPSGAAAAPTGAVPKTNLPTCFCAIPALADVPFVGSIGYQTALDSS